MEAALSGPPRLGSIKVGHPRGLVVERVGCPAIPQSQKEELPGTTSFLKSLGSCLASWLSPIFAKFYLWLEGTEQRSISIAQPPPCFFTT